MMDASGCVLRLRGRVYTVCFPTRRRRAPVPAGNPRRQELAAGPAKTSGRETGARKRRDDGGASDLSDGEEAGGADEGPGGRG